MRVVHDAEKIPERIDDRGRHKSVPEVVWRLILRRAHLEQTRIGGLDVIDMPIAHDAPRIRVLGTHDAQLLRVITQTEFDVLSRNLEVRLEAQELRVPRLRRVEVFCTVPNQGKSTKHVPSPVLSSNVFVPVLEQ